MVSSAGFCLRNAGRAGLHYAAVLVLGVALVAAWTWLDASVPVSGYRTQLVWLALAQGFVGLRLFLRLALARRTGRALPGERLESIPPP